MNGRMPHLSCRLLLASVLLLLLAACQRGGSGTGDSTVSADGADTTRRITLLFAGDLMQHVTQINAARTADGTYDYSSYFDKLADYIRGFDLAVANLEVTLGGKPYSGYPQFCAPDPYIYAIRDAGFDVLSTANNHCCDTGRRGVERTIRMLDSLGLAHVGTYADTASRRRDYPLLVEKNGFRIAFLCYTYGTNGIPVPRGNVVNLIDRAQILTDIRAARAMRPDCIIALMHWGIEYALLPTGEQRELADWLFQNGVTHVIGGHPHVVQPMEVRTDSLGGRHFLAYSLGNFISNQWMENCDGGLMVALTLEKDTAVRLADCSYSLQWVSRPPVSRRKNHRLYPVSYPQDSLNAEERRLMGRFAANARALFAKHNVGDIREVPTYK